MVLKGTAEEWELKNDVLASNGPTRFTFTLKRAGLQANDKTRRRASDRKV